MAPTTLVRASDRIEILRAAIRCIERHPAWAGDRRNVLPSGFGRLDRLLGGGLARGALHDIHAEAAGDSAAATGFALAWAARAQRATPDRPLVWIASDSAFRESGAPYGPGLASYGLDPDALILVRATTLQDALWALEESLRAGAPAAVIGEFSGLPAAYDLTASRRLLLAAQTGQALGLLVFAGFGGSASEAASAAATRFSVTARPGVAAYGVPGRAAWRIDILKNRMGRTGQCSVEWNHDDVAFADPGRVASPAFPGDRFSGLADGSPGATEQAIRRAS